MTRPLNPARAITAPYRAELPPQLPERIRALLGKRPSDLTRRELLDIASDAANRDAWDLCGDREHVGAICDLAGTLEAEIAEERKAHAATRDVLETMLGAAALTGPHDAITVDCALDDETRVATDEELRR